MNRSFASVLSSATALAAMALVSSPRAADACGGFFCAQTPIEQSGEEIAFFVQGNQITAHVRIFYQGSAEEFAWVVPVASPPELGVGTDALFTTLNPMTAPQFYLDWQSGGMCSIWGDDSVADGGAAEGPVAAPSAGVDVLDQKQVGPYDTATIRSDDPQAMRTWLVDNGYDVTEDGIAALQPYIEKGDVFVALKLQQDKGVGDIQPLVMTFTEGSPCIPLRLTAIAALEDMDVTAYVFADERAVPDNYYHVELNEAKINWMQGGANYRAVVKQAADEGFGNAFATEFAGSSKFLANTFHAPGRYDLAILRTLTNPVQFADELLSQGFPRASLIQNLLRKHIPMPEVLVAEGVDERQFYNCLSCYQQHLGPLDADAFVDDLDAQLVTPLVEVQAAVDRSQYLTRLYTLISPKEMTKDPVFLYNDDLGDVTNVHSAKAYPICDEGSSWPYPVRVELDDGRVVVYYPDADGSFPDSQLAGMNAALRVQQMSSSGPGVTVVDNSKSIDSFLEDHNRRSGCGCSVAGRQSTPASGAWALGLLGFIGLAATRRRR